MARQQQNHPPSHQGVSAPDNPLLGDGRDDDLPNDPLTDTGVKGADAIRAALANAPHAPGVYRMFDARDDVLYVAKPKISKSG
ncbi:hypothetical protein JCM17846_14110 [Iodidimonas nitroreducens]|uniref:Uncharacterized protein n=1 Tax=Iodidimonas nitroreducens TaxID=1236968 RepID=A0A5A7N9I5_9PROT|nr:hypothetical protein [Iodidimonas nitroreducens]GER03729.1 hypothetical protein JCM17846_14110 [Iodidimonas nitroreducens]